MEGNQAIHYFLSAKSGLIGSVVGESRAKSQVRVIGAFVPFEAMKARENFDMKILKKGERLKVLPSLYFYSFLFFFSAEFLSFL